MGMLNKVKSSHSVDNDCIVGNNRSLVRLLMTIVFRPQPDKHKRSSWVTKAPGKSIQFLFLYQGGTRLISCSFVHL